MELLWTLNMKKVKKMSSQKFDSELRKHHENTFSGKN